MVAPGSSSTQIWERATRAAAYAAVKRGANDPAAALLVRVGARWLAADAALLPDTDVKGWLWSRGFVTGVRLTWEDWAAHAGAFLGRWPIAEVTLTTLPVVETWVSGRGGTEGRLVGRAGWHTLSEGELGSESDDPFSDLPPVAEFLLAREWPRVRRWRS